MGYTSKLTHYHTKSDGPFVRRSSKIPNSAAGAWSRAQLVTTPVEIVLTCCGSTDSVAVAAV